MTFRCSNWQAKKRLSHELLFMRFSMFRQETPASSIWYSSIGKIQYAQKTLKEQLVAECHEYHRYSAVSQLKDIFVIKANQIPSAQPEEREETIFSKDFTQ